MKLVGAIVALVNAPVVALVLHHDNWSWPAALVGALVAAVAFIGTFDALGARWSRPPALNADATDSEVEVDAAGRRRRRFWLGKLRWAGWYASFTTVAWFARGGSWLGNAGWLLHELGHALTTYGVMGLILPFYFLFNFLILLGPLTFQNVRQMTHLEPGDADFGVKLADVRGQAEAKDEVRKLVNLWQRGDKFVAAGGKRERGALFLGPPGVGKTMIAKAIASSSNAPISIVPGNAFAATFIGVDVMVVQWLVWRAKRLARKWGGQALIFIDEIDAVGMRRQALRNTDVTVQRQMPGGMFGGMGQQGLQSLLVAMDSIDKPPFLRRTLVNKVNTWLDAFFVPTRVRGVKLRLPRAKPRGEQVFWIGATNVDLAALDPALVRPGRMGRHIRFRSPVKRDRLDVIDLYVRKVRHDPALDGDAARDELARITQGFSPAEIEQACMLGLARAHDEGRDALTRADLVEALTDLQMGAALSWGYESTDEERAIAIHEAGHATCAYLYRTEASSTRLSVRRRGESGGHHSSVDDVERFVKTRTQLVNELVWGLGSYGAELVVYGENAQGVGGDLQSASYLAATMVGRWGMVPPQHALEDRTLARRLERAGRRLLVAAGSTDVKLPPTKERDEAVLVGYALTVAYQTALLNEDALQRIADTLCDRKELVGDEVDALLTAVGLRQYDREAMVAADVPDAVAI